MDGAIGYAPRDDGREGACFWVELPLSAQPMADAALCHDVLPHEEGCVHGLVLALVGKVQCCCDEGLVQQGALVGEVVATTTSHCGTSLKVNNVLRGRGGGAHTYIQGS